MLVAALCAAPVPEPSRPAAPSPQPLVRSCRLAPWLTRRPSGAVVRAGRALAGRRVIAALCCPCGHSVAAPSSFPPEPSPLAFNAPARSRHLTRVEPASAAYERRRPGPHLAASGELADRPSRLYIAMPASPSSSPLSSSSIATPSSPTRGREASGLELRLSSAADPSLSPATSTSPPPRPSPPSSSVHSTGSS
jgi:hypothetical protein